MIRHVVVCSALCLPVAGCDQQVSPPPPPRAFAKHDLNGGRYFIDCEDTGGGSSLSFRSAGDGTAVATEVYDFTWGGGHQLRIEDGKLTVDGVDRGRLRPGDRITITAAGEVLVNGSKR